jgi:hypothetical protein
MEIWRRLEGQKVDSYPLLMCIGAGEKAAVCLTHYSDHPAVVKIELASPDDPDSWEPLTQLTHPNLIRMFATGRGEIEAQPVRYAVMEQAEETLATVLKERPLTPQETREMLAPALNVLSYIHKNGYVHTGFRPANIMAIGDTLKLSSDNIRPAGSRLTKIERSPFDAPELEEKPLAPASDIWSLGMTVMEALTRRAALPDSTVGLPEPFGEIIRRSLRADPQERPTVDQLAAHLRGEPLPPPRLIAAPPPMPAPFRAEPTDKEPPVRRPLYAFGGAALLVLVIILLFRGLTGGGSAPKPTPATTAPAATNPGPSSPAPEPTATAPAPRPKPAPAPVKKRRRDGGWYVVVATYAQRDAAQKRAHSITQKYPKFPASVFDPPVRNPHHLVVIGKDLTEDEAQSLQKRARSAGLPRDVYIKRF